MKSEELGLLINDLTPASLIGTNPETAKHVVDQGRITDFEHGVAIIEGNKDAIYFTSNNKKSIESDPIDSLLIPLLIHNKS